MKKVTVAMTEEMFRDLEKERKERRLASVAEAARVVIGDYLANKYRKTSNQPLVVKDLFPEASEKR